MNVQEENATGLIFNTSETVWNLFSTLMKMQENSSIFLQ